jgi:hypothetical protein
MPKRTALLTCPGGWCKTCFHAFLLHKTQDEFPHQIVSNSGQRRRLARRRVPTLMLSGIRRQGSKTSDFLKRAYIVGIQINPTRTCISRHKYVP